MKKEFMTSMVTTGLLLCSLIMVSDVAQAGQEQEQGQPGIQDEQIEVQQIRSPQEGDLAQKLEGYSLVAISPAKAYDWIGRELIGSDGQKLGTISKAYSAEDGTIRYLLVEGEQGTLHPVPLELVEAVELLKTNAGEEGISAKIGKQAFEQSPAFGENDVPILTEQEWTEKIESHYGISPAWQNTTDEPDQSMMMDQQNEEQYQQKNMGEEGAPGEPPPSD